MYEEYWLTTGVNSLQVSLAYREGYYMTHLPRLEKAVRGLHALVGNAVTSGRHIVVGVGSYELLVAAVHAFTSVSSIQPPHFPTVRARSPHWKWPSVSLSVMDGPFPFSSGICTNGTVAIELVTSPNNPDSQLRVKETSAPFTIFDHAYYWPQFVGTETTAYDNDSISTFSLAKVAGLASTRIGWAFTSNATLVQAMNTYTFLKRLTLPIDAQLKAVVALEHIIQTDGALIRQARVLMLRRWADINAIFTSCSDWRHESHSNIIGRDVFSGNDRYRSTPAHLWIIRLDGSNAQLHLREAGIGSNSGTGFFAGLNFARLTLMQREHDFVSLMNKFKKMCSYDPTLITI